MSNYCLYHGDDCADGFGAAFALYLKYGNEYEYYDINYDNDFPFFFLDKKIKNLFLLDFNVSKENLQIFTRNYPDTNFTIIDHHNGYDYHHGNDKFGIDLNNDYISNGFKLIHSYNMSAAVLTYKYLFPDQLLPALFAYIQDRDLWHWVLPSSREFSAGLQLIPKTFDEWTIILEQDPIHTILNGRNILKYTHKIINKIIKDSCYAELTNVKQIPMVNSPILQSELGEALLTKYPNDDLVAVYHWGVDVSHYRLFSRIGSNIDVSLIARSLGGGGSKHVGGFTITL